MTLLSASRLNDYLGCEHQAALWLEGVVAEEAPDATVKLIRDKGFEHEAAVLEALKAKYGSLVEIPKEGKDREDLTKAAIKGKAPLISQAALVHGSWQGYPDFLVGRNEGDKFLIEPEDAKLSRKPKGEHVLQLGIYAELLEKLFAFPVGDGTIHVAQGSPVTFDLRRTRHILSRLKTGFEAFVAQPERKTEPLPCAECQNCDFRPRCEQEWRAKDSPYYVAGLTGAQVVKLEAAGIITLAQLAEQKSGTAVEGISNETLAKLIAQAKLQLAKRTTGKHSFEFLALVPGRGFANLPPPDAGDLFFDMEGDPLAGEGLEYLFGIYGQIGGTPKNVFQPFWGHNPAEEKIAFENTVRLFMDQMRKYPKAHIYHYADYETTALKRLAMRHATMEAEVDQLLRERRFVDLYRVVVQALRASTESYSLKDIEKIYGRDRSSEVKTASASIVEYENWCTTGDNSILDAIERYNEEDVVSTAEMREWLESLRPANAGYNPVQPDSEGKQDKAAEREAREQNQRDVAAAVRVARHGDERLRGLIAELLWFHQRAAKPGWWAVFDRQQWSDDELIDDAECLGGLVRDPDIAPVQIKRSFEYAFRFIPQDTKLKPGDAPKIAETVSFAGTIVTLDAEVGIVTIKRGVASGELPTKFSLIPAPIDPGAVPGAVLSFAQRFAAVPPRNDQATLAILGRALPRLKGRTQGDPIHTPNEDLTEEVIRAIKDLDHSYLVIQGPPGTGKTYTAARAIVTLLKAGKRVGVSSNSHRAIGKLLQEVESHAAEIGYRFSGAKKGSSDNPETHLYTKNIITMMKSEEVSAAHRLVGGTVFHFSREDQLGSFDYLFIDEAGQVALGNLVAMGPCASNIVLIGDQMQLPQPVQGVHPGETGHSCLEYLLQGHATVPDERGILLNVTRRLHPKLCEFISEAIYDGRLTNDPLTEKRKLIHAGTVHPAIKEAGLSFLAVSHGACTQSSEPEALAICELIQNLLTQKISLVDGIRNVRLDDVLVVAPYNLQVNLLRQKLPEGVRIGTVDKFQGQEAPVVIVSMTTSRGTDAPRGTEFLFNSNRFNVAVSRAQCLAIVVHGTELLDGAWTKIEDLRRLNLFAHAEVVAQQD